MRRCICTLYLPSVDPSLVNIELVNYLQKITIYTKTHTHKLSIYSQEHRRDPCETAKANLHIIIKINFEKIFGCG